MGCGFRWSAASVERDRTARFCPECLAVVRVETSDALDYLAASEAATKAMPVGPERFAAGMAVRHVPPMIRPRTLLYAGVLVTVLAVMLGSWFLRTTLSLTALRDRAPLFVHMSDGSIRNDYTLKLVNKTRDDGALTLVVDGPQGLRLVVQDATSDASGRPQLALRPDGITQWRALITAPPGARLPESVPVTFRLLDAQGRSLESVRSVFLGPKP